MSDDIEELKALIVAKLDVTDFLDILGIEMAELVELLEDQVEENRSQLHRACR